MGREDTSKGRAAGILEVLPLDVQTSFMEMIGGDLGEDMWKTLSNLDVAVCTSSQRIFWQELLSSPYLPMGGPIEVTPRFPSFLVWLYNRRVQLRYIGLRFGGPVNWNADEVRHITLPSVTQYAIEESEPCPGIVDEMLVTSRSILQMCPNLTSVNITGAARDPKIFHTALLAELRNFPAIPLSQLVINATIDIRDELNLCIHQFRATLTSISLAAVTVEATTFKALASCTRLTNASLVIGPCSEEELTEFFCSCLHLRDLTLDFESRSLPLPAIVSAMLASKLFPTSLNIYHADREAFVSFARLLSSRKSSLECLYVCGNEYTQSTGTLAVCGVLCPVQFMQILDVFPEQSLHRLQVFRHGAANLAWNVWDTVLTRFGQGLRHLILHEASTVTGTMLPSTHLPEFLSRLPSLNELTLSLSYFISLESVDQVLAETCTRLLVVELKCFPMHEQELIYLVMRCPNIRQLKLMLAGNLAPYAKWKNTLKELGYNVDLIIASS